MSCPSQGLAISGEIMGRVRPFLAAWVACCVLCVAAFSAHADSRADKLNQNTLGLLAADSQWLSQAIAIATVVQHDQGLRVLPIAGAGTLQGVSDLAYLDRVDAALVPLDTLTYAQAQGLLDGLGGKITYLARLQPVAWALIVPKDVEDISALSGKRIATGPTGSMGFVAGELIFNAQNIQFSRVPRQNNEAVAMLNQGNADAALVDASILRTARLDAKRWKVLPLPVPKQLDSTYVPVMLGNNDVPALIPKDADVESLAAPLAVMVLARAPDKATDTRLKNFTTALLRNAGRLKINANLSAEIPGWTRHRAAQAALNELAAEATAGAETEIQQGDGQ